MTCVVRIKVHSITVTEKRWAQVVVEVELVKLLCMKAFYRILSYMLLHAAAAGDGNHSHTSSYVVSLARRGLKVVFILYMHRKESNDDSILLGSSNHTPTIHSSLRLGIDTTLTIINALLPSMWAKKYTQRRFKVSNSYNVRSRYL